MRWIGGAELLDDARVEAEWYAALYVPWSGAGDEPLDQLCARVEVLGWRLDRARDADRDSG